jgi:hypothetical protein
MAGLKAGCEPAEITQRKSGKEMVEIKVSGDIIMVVFWCIETFWDRGLPGICVPVLKNGFVCDLGKLNTPVLRECGIMFR